MLNTTQFLSWFPEFSSLTTAQIDAKILQSSYEFAFSDRFDLLTTAEYAEGLFVAHLLTLPAPSIGGGASVGGPPGTVIKRVKSRNEEIEYDVSGQSSSTEAASLEGTVYGLRLLDMLRNMYLGAWLVP